jgi:hypothetical protein
MKWVKRSLSVSAMVLLLVGFAVTSYAKGGVEQNPQKTYTINTIQELLAKLRSIQENHPLLLNDDAKNGVKDINRNYIIDNTNLAILSKYMNTLDNEIKSKFNQMSKVKTKLSGTDYFHQDKSDLSDGGYVEVTVSDQADPSSSDGDISPMYTITKGYGSRYYTVQTHIYHLLYPDTYMGLRTYYNIGSYGLKATSTSAVGTSAVFPNTIVANTHITDAYAQKDGYDINGQGDYVYTLLGYNGIGIYTQYHTIVSSIKLLDLYSDSAYLSQTYQYD